MEEKIGELIKKGESERVEFKPSLSQMNEIVQIICGFVNNQGGMLLVGVSDSGGILGCEIGKDTIERLVRKHSMEIILRY